MREGEGPPPGTPAHFSQGPLEMLFPALLTSDTREFERSLIQELFEASGNLVCNPSARGSFVPPEPPRDGGAHLEQDPHTPCTVPECSMGHPLTEEKRQWCRTEIKGSRDDGATKSLETGRWERAGGQTSQPPVCPEGDPPHSLSLLDPFLHISVGTGRN